MQHLPSRRHSLCISFIPISGCAISRPRKMQVTFTLFPFETNSRACPNLVKKSCSSIFGLNLTSFTLIWCAAPSYSPFPLRLVIADTCHNPSPCKRGEQILRKSQQDPTCVFSHSQCFVESDNSYLLPLLTNETHLWGSNFSIYSQLFLFSSIIRQSKRPLKGPLELFARQKTALKVLKGRTELKLSSSLSRS